jgi:hypothetical protein
MQPYREPDRSELADFAQHISIAETLYVEFTSYPGRVQAMLKQKDFSTELLSELQWQGAAAWERLWEQLRQARDIAARLGRDVTSFDIARKRAGDIWGGGTSLELGAWQGAGQRQRGRLVTWRAAPHEPARAAIAAMRAAIPEVVIPKAPKDEPVVDLRKRPVWPWICLLVIVLFIVSRFI